MRSICSTDLFPSISTSLGSPVSFLVHWLCVSLLIHLPHLLVFLAVVKTRTEIMTSLEQSWSLIPFQFLTVALLYPGTLLQSGIVDKKQVLRGAISAQRANCYNGHKDIVISRGRFRASKKPVALCFCFKTRS